MVIINVYLITQILESTQKHKNFCLELVWDLINNASSKEEIQLRVCSQ
ncbi:10910_t:CDS:2 [Cetraspora pellucida]|uniref:10910_t:CDS:1 n=1 Tax=Cetraspora pellucida TaxID=1433469 RepID=A0A9N9CTM7_9GLOM|nr:10910_t:CDS:2 [Cetraspora pellucida]